MAVTTSRLRATVNVSNGALSSLRRESAPATVRERENTSNGPAKSSTSTSSKIRMPTVLRALLFMLYAPAPPDHLPYAVLPAYPRGTCQLRMEGEACGRAAAARLNGSRPIPTQRLYRVSLRYL